MTSYPILFSVKDLVAGRGFLAGVAIQGRALMREEEEGFWIDGVFPGAVSAGGESKDEALLKYREAYRMSLVDFAIAASSFEEFEAETKRFFWEETPGEADAWKAAAAELREDQSLSGDWLPVRTQYGEPTIHVVLLEQQDLEPARNPEDEMELAGDAYGKVA